MLVLANALRLSAVTMTKCLTPASMLLETNLQPPVLMVLPACITCLLVPVSLCCKATRTKFPRFSSTLRVTRSSRLRATRLARFGQRRQGTSYRLWTGTRTKFFRVHSTTRATRSLLGQRTTRAASGKTRQSFRPGRSKFEKRNE